MLIGIEATRANKPLKTGVEWYAWHVIQQLKQVTAGDPHSWTLYSNEVLAGGLEHLPDNWYEVRLGWPFPYGWTQLRLSWEMSRRPADAIWFPATTLPRLSGKRTVVTVHDVGFHHLPELYKTRQVVIHERAMKEVGRRADRVIAVSAFAAREMSEAYGIDPARITVTPLGVDHDLYRPLTDPGERAVCRERYRLAGPFVMTVGRVERKKNLAFLVRAFEAFKARRGTGEPLKLVIVGTDGFGAEDVRRLIARSPVRSDIVELGYVPVVDLPCLLNESLALVHPSLHEGFGLTPLEAMASGCPVLSSNAGSLPEVQGDAAAFFSPHETEQLVELLDRITSDENFRQDLRAKGLVRAKTFTWRRTAELTKPVLSEW